MFRMGCVLALGLVAVPACAAEELIAGRIQKVIQQPSGADACPRPCPVEPEKSADGRHRVCVSNAGGCETMEIKVERDLLGRRESGSVWTVSRRVGEWGPAFPVTSELIVVHEDNGRLRWTPAVLRDGQVLVHPQRYVSVVRAVKREWFGADTAAMVPVEQVLEQLRSGR